MDVTVRGTPQVLLAGISLLMIFLLDNPPKIPYDKDYTKRQGTGGVQWDTRQRGPLTG